MRARVLFICKRRQKYWGKQEALAPEQVSSGLSNSVKFLVDMLPGMGVAAKAVEVVDNNSIDAAVTSYQPTHAIIEALWVVPEKFDVLNKLHPRVQWIVRLHSEAAFLAQEGVAVQWVAGYLQRGVEVMCNSASAQSQLKTLAVDIGGSETMVTYGPNYYPSPGATASQPKSPVADGYVHVGCFGAIRPLKNQFAQAVAAISFANSSGDRLRFHINAGRQEGAGSNAVLRNLRALFASSAGARHQLVEHGWLSHANFLNLLTQTDIGMQVSMSETFNIVAADSVASGLPVIVSPEVPWIGSYAQVDPTDTGAMANALTSVWDTDTKQRLASQASDLAAWSLASQNMWGARFAS